MSAFADVQRHNENPPESWQVIKIAERRWALATADAVDPENNAGERIDTFDTMREAQTARVDGFMARLWRKESDWYAGKDFAGWKPYAVVRNQNEKRGFNA